MTEIFLNIHGINLVYNSERSDYQKIDKKLSKSKPDSGLKNNKNIGNMIINH